MTSLERLEMFLFMGLKLIYLGWSMLWVSMASLAVTLSLNLAFLFSFSEELSGKLGLTPSVGY